MKPGKSHLLLTIFVAAQGFLLVAEAQAQRTGHARGAGHRASSGSHRAQAHSQRVPHRRGPSTRSGRSLISPGFGSAANVRPGFYRNLDSPHQGRHHGGAHVVPVYVYPVYPEPYYPGPVNEPAYAEPAYAEPPPAPAPVPAPPPIYIVQPQPIAAPAPAPPPAPVPPPAPRSTEPGEVQFSILPGDAEIYLDDDYLGTGEELATLEGQMFAPGVHVLEVTHPDYRPQRLVFGVSSTDPSHVLIDLSIDRVGRRSRIK